jgi:hypothetical protein
MVLLIISSLLLFVAYMAYALRAIKDIPWSISDTYYQLEKRGRKKWPFQLAMIVPAMLLLPAWLECSDENLQFLAFLSSSLPPSFIAYSIIVFNILEETNQKHGGTLYFCAAKNACSQ